MNLSILCTDNTLFYSLSENNPSITKLDLGDKSFSVNYLDQVEGLVKKLEPLGDQIEAVNLVISTPYVLVPSKYYKEESLLDYLRADTTVFDYEEIHSHYIEQFDLYVAYISLDEVKLYLEKKYPIVKISHVVGALLDNIEPSVLDNDFTSVHVFPFDHSLVNVVLKADQLLSVESFPISNTLDYLYYMGKVLESQEIDFDTPEFSVYESKYVKKNGSLVTLLSKYSSKINIVGGTKAELFDRIL